MRLDQTDPRRDRIVEVPAVRVDDVQSTFTGFGQPAVPYYMDDEDGGVRARHRLADVLARVRCRVPSAPPPIAEALQHLRDPLRMPRRLGKWVQSTKRRQAVFVLHLDSQTHSQHFSCTSAAAVQVVHIVPHPDGHTIVSRHRAKTR